MKSDSERGMKEVGAVPLERAFLPSSCVFG